MPELASLISQLAQCDAKHDVDGLRRIREQIIGEHPQSEAAAEAHYKLGLDRLFLQRDFEAAVTQFNEAAKRKDSYWSMAARTSLGICYYHQKRTQKALLELRKVAHTETPNAHSITALSFLENIFDTEGQPDEVKRVRKERIEQLRILLSQEPVQKKPQEHGYYLYTLALALKDQGDDEGARTLLEQAKALGKVALGAELHRSVTEALSWR